MRKIFFKNEQELAKHTPSNIGVSIEALSAKITEAQEDYIVSMIGQNQFDSIMAKYEDGDMSELETELVNKIQYVVANAALAEYAPDLNVNAKNGGFTVSSDERNQVASGYRVEAWITARLKSAQSGIDKLLKFLEENISSFNDYAESDERAKILGHFINTTEDYNKYLSIKINRYVLVKMLPVIDRIEQWMLRNVLCDELFDYMLDKIQAADSLEEYEVLMPKIQRALAHAVLAEAIEEIGVQVDSSYGAFIRYTKNANEPLQTKALQNSEIDRLLQVNRKLAEQSWALLKGELIANVDNYSLYASSDCYAGTKPAVNTALADDTDGFLLSIGK